MPSPSTPVLLLHGQPGNAHDWDAVRAAIDARADALAIDRPGWDGRSAPTDLAGNAAAAVAALNAQRIERAVVVGHSLGGAVAAWLAVEHPDRVAALVLAAPSASCESLNRLDEILAMPVLGPALATSAFTGIGLALKLPGARKRVADRFPLSEDYLRGYARMLLNPLTWHAFVVEQRMLVRELPELETRLPAIATPTTIVSGTADRIVSPASARNLAALIPGAQLVQLPHSSHLLLQERPAALAELILEAASGGSAAPVAASQDWPGSG